METALRGSTSCNSPPLSNQDSSSRLIAAPPDTSNIRSNETLDPKDHLRQQERQPRRESYPYADPDPPQPVSQTPPAPPASGVRYRECQKNHAATMGTHVVDGCGEFLPGGEDGTPEALRCAACLCHRSFHRQEVEGDSKSYYYARPSINPPAAAVQRSPIAFSPHQQQRHRRHHHPTPTPPIMMAFGGAPAESSSEDLNIFQTHVGPGQPSKKRVRTKFTQEQKEKMHDFAERIGWKIQKQDEQQILQLCNEVGIKRQVFKVWMHNSKQAMKKKQV